MRWRKKITRAESEYFWKSLPRAVEEGRRNHEENERAIKAVRKLFIILFSLVLFFYLVIGLDVKWYVALLLGIIVCPIALYCFWKLIDFYAQKFFMWQTSRIEQEAREKREK